jgi:hypothetical protein
MYLRFWSSLAISFKNQNSISDICIVLLDDMGKEWGKREKDGTKEKVEGGWRYIFV